MYKQYLKGLEILSARNWLVTIFSYFAILFSPTVTHHPNTCSSNDEEK